MEGDGQLEPVKKTTATANVNRGGRQATPLTKADHQTGSGLSATDAKDPVEEKLAGARDSDNTDLSLDPPAGKDASISHETAPNNVNAKATTEPARLVDGEARSGSNPAREQPRPSQPEAVNQLDGNSTDREPTAAISPVKVAIQPPTPVVPQQETMAATSETMRLPAKDPIDEAASQALPTPVGDDEPSESSGAEATTTSTARPDLPPPPPLPTPADRAADSRLAVGGQGNEPTQWLLPPLQPRFQGKKCLVLDLDETLVHSSFKVSAGRYRPRF